MDERLAEIVAIIPRLRRHAYLLTGSTEVGDEHVHSCLELAMAEPERLEGDSLPAQLFRSFHAANTSIETIDDPLTNLTGGYQERVKAALGLLPLPERRALLLVAVERFSIEQTAHVLDLTDDDVRDLLATARQRLETLVAKSVLIIEDEPLIAMQLDKLTADMGFTSARIVKCMQDAIAAAAMERPDLVIADLQLDGEGNGIEAAEAILQKRDDLPVVFVTGYPERLREADDFGPAFVVKKPFSDNRLKSVIGRALATYASPSHAAAHRETMLAKLKQLVA